MGEGSGVAVMSCGVGCSFGLDLALLWLWYRLVAIALIGPLAWEPPYPMGTALKKTKKFFFKIAIFFSSLFVFLGLHLLHMEVPRLGVQSEL